MRCPLSTWRKKAVEVDFFGSGRCLPWLHYGHQLRCNCEDVWSADGALFLRHSICPFPCFFLLQRLQRNLVRLSFLCFVRLAIVAVHHSTWSCRHFRVRVCSVPKMRGATRCVGQRHGVRWWGARGAWSDGSLGLKAKDGQGVKDNCNQKITA